VERGSVYLSPRFDLYLTAGHLWTKGSGARCCGCVFMRRELDVYDRCCVLYH
jgi:hypothetical protein